MYTHIDSVYACHDIIYETIVAYNYYSKPREELGVVQQKIIDQNQHCPISDAPIIRIAISYWQQL